MKNAQLTEHYNKLQKGIGGIDINSLLNFRDDYEKLKDEDVMRLYNLIVSYKMQYDNESVDSKNKRRLSYHYDEMVKELMELISKIQKDE